MVCLLVEKGIPRILKIFSQTCGRVPASCCGGLKYEYARPIALTVPKKRAAQVTLRLLSKEEMSTEVLHWFTCLPHVCLLVLRCLRFISAACKLGQSALCRTVVSMVRSEVFSGRPKGQVEAGSPEQGP